MQGRIDENTINKEKILRRNLKKLGGAVIAFSGGVDSAYLLRVAREVLGEKVLAVTIDSQIFHRARVEEAAGLARKLGVAHRIVEINHLQNQDFCSNGPDRCYICKRMLLERLKDIAFQVRLPAVIEGTNANDTRDFRPGRKAVEEMGARSPLLEAGLTKEEIRVLSRKLCLEVWDKPSDSCLCSRIPYGDEIELRKIEQIRKAEELLHKSGFKEVRVRHHGNIARIELPREKIKQIIDDDVFVQELVKDIEELGFTYVTFDLKGFRSGSLNIVLGEGSNSS